jgi:hypothetical protein
VVSAVKKAVQSCFAVYRFYSGFLEHIPLIYHFCDRVGMEDFVYFFEISGCSGSCMKENFVTGGTFNRIPSFNTCNCCALSGIDIV